MQKRQQRQHRKYPLFCSPCSKGRDILTDYSEENEDKSKIRCEDRESYNFIDFKHYAFESNQDVQVQLEVATTVTEETAWRAGRGILSNRNK